ncbi:MAG TPA: hypothetical protein VFO41_01505 [Alphaproteobacteria bacterium]|nr:hypothetical protein [Alphaproteobacteria bacterium]
MPPRSNPLKLNPLQAKTLTILQQMARSPRHAATPEDDGSIMVGSFPPPHGDHYHVGDAVVMGSDATGLFNPAVFTALARKGLVRPSLPGSAVLTPEGLAYDTGLADRILHRAHH